MHILFLTDNFPPEVNAPASRTYEHAREWVLAGHAVTVVTCAPNFPDGKLFAGYKNSIIARETVDGINVIRVWTYITANEGFFRRTLDYASFMVSATMIAPFCSRADIVIATSPQFFTAVAGLAVSRLLGAPFVFEVRDLWPESLIAVGAMKRRLIYHLLEKLERFLYRKADCIVTVTHSFQKILADRGIDDSKIHVVTNGVDLARFRPRLPDNTLKKNLGFDGKFLAGYVGTHGMAHGLNTLLDAAALINEQGRDDIYFLLLGSGAEKAQLKRRAKRMQLGNVLFLDSVPRTEVTRYWSLLDASIIHLRDEELFSTVIPSKLFECMAMGVPVLHGVNGESALILERSNAGLLFAPCDENELAAGIVRLADDKSLCEQLGANGLMAAANYDRKKLADQMLDIFQGVLKKTSPKN